MISVGAMGSSVVVLYTVDVKKKIKIKKKN